MCSALKKKMNPAIGTGNRLSTSDDYAFDDAGNTTSDPDGRTFIYDGENKQVKVLDSEDETVGEYWYDGDGKRVKKYAPPNGTFPGETTIFVYDAAGKLVAEYSVDIASTENAKVAYVTNDHLGSPRINTDKNGNVTARHDYHPFGEEIATTQRAVGLAYADDTVRQQFTGYEHDPETELDFAQARYFTSVLGRFSSPDDFFNDTAIIDPQSWNLYVYVRNNPLNYVDPTGKKIWISFTETITEFDEDGNEVQRSVQRTVEYRNGGLLNEDGSEYAGDNSYALQARDFLNILSQDKVLGAMIGDLVTSGKNHTIMRNPQFPDVNRQDDVPNGTIVYWSGKDSKVPNGKGGDVDQKAIYSLAHELLGHAWFVDKSRQRTGGIECVRSGGCYSPGKRPNLTEPFSPVANHELDAVSVENRARNLLGDSDRTYYSTNGDISESIRGNRWNPRQLKPSPPAFAPRSRRN